jgi:hypothetical protein
MSALALRRAALACMVASLFAPFARAQDNAAAKPESSPQATAPRFSLVLWTPLERAGDEARLAAVRAAGFDAINLGPTGDPAPLRKQGLGFYLDQPIGKGFLELRDTEWKPIGVGMRRLLAMLICTRKQPAPARVT